jgi:uncharacterized protein
MPSQLTYPGVYIEEISSGVRTITGVATSITAFMGSALKGPVNKAVTINSYADFERIFGGLWVDSTLGYAVRDFYFNGGSQAIIVRLFHSKFANETDLTKAIAAAKAVTNAAKATSPGSAAKTAATGIKTAYLAVGSGKTTEEKDIATAVADEIGRLLDDAADGPTIIATADSIARKATQSSKAKILIGALKLESAHEGISGANLRVRIDLDDILQATPALQTTFNLTIQDATAGGATERFLNLSIQPNSPRRFDKVLKSESNLVRVDGVWAAATPNLTAINTAITALKADPSNAGKQDAVWTITQDKITQTESKYLRAKKDREKKQNDPSTSGDVDSLKTAEKKVADALDAEKSTVAEAISDGLPLTINDFLPPNGATEKKGMYTLEQADIFNLLCIPPYKNGLDVDLNLISAAADYCEKRRAMLLVDPPSDWEDKAKAKDKFSDPTEDFVGTRSRNAALFFPRLKQPNPLRENQIEEFVPCGVVAGIFARTDSQRGIWKAPAGLDATLVGVPQLSVNLTDPENGELNPLGINCLRAFPVVGRVVWGSRTLRGADRLADEYKYIPVRRLALYMEESLYRGTQWVVFEPNDEPLWAQIRLNIGAFMNNLFRQGAFQGRTPQEAYFVKCSSETTTQNDINLGIVNIIVGFAPLKPAEFVVIKFQQIAGNIAI